MKIKCPKCGFEGQGRYCSNCGASFERKTLWYQFTLGRLPFRAAKTYWYLLTRPSFFFKRQLSRDSAFIATVSGSIPFVLIMLALSVTFSNIVSSKNHPIFFFHGVSFLFEEGKIEHLLNTFNDLDYEGFQKAIDKIPSSPSLDDLEQLREVQGGYEFGDAYFQLTTEAVYWEPGFGLSMSYDLAEQLIVLFLLVGISRFLHGRLPSTGRSREDTTAVVLYISGLLWPLISLARALSRLAEPQTYSVGYFLFNLFYPIAMMIAVIMITAALIRRSHQVKYRTSSWAVVKSSFLFFPLFGILKYWIVIFIFWKIFDNWERLVELDEILNF